MTIKEFEELCLSKASQLGIITVGFEYPQGRYKVDFGDRIDDLDYGLIISLYQEDDLEHLETLLDEMLPYAIDKWMKYAEEQQESS